MVKSSKQLTPRKKAVVLALKSEGVPNRAITRRHDFTEGPIRKFLHRAKDGQVDRKNLGQFDASVPSQVV